MRPWIARLVVFAAASALIWISLIPPAGSHRSLDWPAALLAQAGIGLLLALHGLLVRKRRP